MSVYRLIKKELLLTFKNPQILVSIFIIPILFISMAGSIRYGIEATQQEIERTISIGIAAIVKDNSNITMNVIRAINTSSGVRIIIINPPYDIEKLLDRYGIVVEVPENFWRNIVDKRLCYIYGYTSINSLSIASIASRTNVIDHISSFLCRAMRNAIALEMNIDINKFDINTRSSKTVFIGNKAIDEDNISRLSTSITMSSMIFSIAIAMAFQYGAISIAQEKEEKTLEILITQPITRRALGISKIIGVLILALIEASLYIASWIYYIDSMGLAGGSGMLIDLGLKPLIFLMINIVIVTMALTISGLIIGLFARDTRTASIVSAPITIIAIFIGIAVQFLGIPLESVKLVLYSTTLIMAPICIMISSMLGFPIYIVLGILTVNAIIVLILLYILNKILESEKMFTGMGITDIFRRVMMRNR